MYVRDDSDLVVRLKQRDRNAMASLYDQYGAALFSLTLRVVRNSAVAEDLVQETFLRVWNRVNGFDERRGSFGPWVLTIGRNLAIDSLRAGHDRLRNRLPDLQQLENPALFLNLENGILRVDLKDALDKLKPEQRALIEMAFYDGFSQSEISKCLRQPLGTVKSRIRTALRILRENVRLAAPYRANGPDFERRS